MAEEGIKIDAITIQNEPHHPGNNPSMYMSSADQAEFVGAHLSLFLRKKTLTLKSSFGIITLTNTIILLKYSVILKQTLISMDQLFIFMQDLLLPFQKFTRPFRQKPLFH